MQGNNPFNVIGDGPVSKGQNTVETDKTLDIKTRIERLIKSSPVFLFMKGEPLMPQCGFSAQVVAVLDSLGVEYRSFNILTDMEIREGVKQYANWPTYPQLWYKGELLGGCDIVMEMFHSKQLQEVLKS